MYKFKFADIGEGLHEGTVGEVYLKEGDKVNEGDSLFSVETDKVTSDIPSPVAGTISKVLIKQGETVHVGDVTMHIDDGSGEDAEEAVEVKSETVGEESASVVGDIKVSNELFSFDAFKKKPQPAKKDTPVAKTTPATALTNEKAFNLSTIEAKGNGEKVDVVVIGGGPAGYKAAATLAKGGLKVVNIEKEAFGGTCVNVGCIPVKTLIKSAKVYRYIKEGKKYGFSVNLDHVKADVEAINKRRWEVSKTLAAGAEQVVKASKATAVKGEAHVIDKHNVKVNDKVYTTKLIFVATGAKPETIDLPGFSDGYKAKKIIDSTTALDLKALPKTLTIIGALDHGGPTIDVNFAQILADLGVKVTLVKQAPALGNLMDKTMQKAILQSLTKSGVQVILDAKVTKFANDELHYEVAGKAQTIKSDNVLAATGRDALPTDFITKLKLATDTRGFVKVNNFFQTNVDNVFAVGDITGNYLLAHEAFRQGIVAANYVLGNKLDYKQHLVPKTVYTYPEIAAVGYTEEELKAQKVDYIKGEWVQQFEGKSVADGETEGMTKILIGKTHGEILGAHIQNSTAIDAINEITALMEVEGTIDELVNMSHPHPATSESIWDAALVAYDSYKKVNKK